jgi:stage II sporulation protein AB (anti-sigma F factor)
MDGNRVSLTMAALSVNESFARIAVSAFIAPLDPTYGELSDIKTAVSEAVTNAIIHGYGQKSGEIRMNLEREGRRVAIEVIDDGIGIVDVEKARVPLYTTEPGLDRSGMGFTVMESFMDEVRVRSEPGKGTAVIMVKTLDN